MKKMLTTGLALASSVIAIALVSACSAPLDDEDSALSNEALQGPGIWQLQRECGTKETGKCGDVPACGAERALGGECPNAGARCLTAPLGSGLKQVLMCNPTSNSTWTYNGDCANDKCKNLPACDKNDNTGDRCRYPLKRCGKNGRALVCLTNGKDQYVFSGYCGENGGPACAGIAACPRDPDGMAGLACDALGATCKHKTGNLTGKVFTCLSR